MKNGDFPLPAMLVLLEGRGERCANMMKDQLVCGGMMIEKHKASFLGRVIFGGGEPGRSLF